MLHWQELSTLALLGTDRSSIADNLVEAFKLYNIDTSATPSRQVLEAAATFGVMKRAGYALETLENVSSKPPVENIVNWCSVLSSKHLKVILEKNQKDVLQEFLLHASEQQKVIAPEFLPELLDLCLRSEGLWDVMQSVIGERGIWLANQNPVWQYLVYNNAEIDWVLADIQEKIALLQYWRKTDPAEAIELLEWTWKEEKPADKKQFLKILSISLSLADEDFLENCLDDSRKEIRSMAVSYLETLEGSLMMQRRVERIKPFMNLQHSEQLGYKMDIQPFNGLTDTDIRDGLSLKLQWKNSGSAMGIPFHILKNIPPFYWETYFKISKKELVESYVQSDWSELLLQATIEAAAQFGDEKWCAHLLLFAINHQYQARWAVLNIEALIPIINNDFFNSTAIRLLDQTTSLFDEKSILVQLLLNPDQPWNLDLGKQLMHYFSAILNDSHTPYWWMTTFKSILKNAAYRCPPTSFEVLQRIVPQNKVQWSVWEEDYSRFIKVLKFRKEMVQALQS